MGIALEVHGRMRTARTGRVQRAALFAALAALCLITAAGCGTKPSGKASAGGPSGDSKPATSTGAKTGTTAKGSSTARPVASSANRVLLTQKGCVHFEPQWVNVGVGQSITWHSDLKATVTLHVSPGAFARTEYVVRPGATLASGPALSAGSYSIWTEPGACQGAPRGTLGSSPGVMVEDAAHR